MDSPVLWGFSSAGFKDASCISSSWCQGSDYGPDGADAGTASAPSPGVGPVLLQAPPSVSGGGARTAAFPASSVRSPTWLGTSVSVFLVTTPNPPDRKEGELLAHQIQYIRMNWVTK